MTGRVFKMWDFKWAGRGYRRALSSDIQFLYHGFARILFCCEIANVCLMSKTNVLICLNVIEDFVN